MTLPKKFECLWQCLIDHLGIDVACVFRINKLIMVTFPALITAAMRWFAMTQLRRFDEAVLAPMSFWATSIQTRSGALPDYRE